MAEEGTEDQEAEAEEPEGDELEGEGFGEEEEDGGEDEFAPAKKSKKKLIIMAALALLVIGGGGGGAYFFMSAGGDKDKGSAKAVIKLSKSVRHEFPQLLTDLKSGRCKSPFIKIKPVVELPADLLPKLKDAELVIIDEFRDYLRTQTKKEIVGKEGTIRLRKNFAEIVNRELAPDKIVGVLFRELYLQ